MIRDFEADFIQVQKTVQEYSGNSFLEQDKMNVFEFFAVVRQAMKPKTDNRKNNGKRS